MIRLQLLAVACTLAMAACTPNGLVTTTGGGGGGVTHVVNINLTLSQPAPSKYGQTGAFTPPLLTVKVGDSIVFKNTDSFAHTSTIIPPAKTTNESKFPTAYPFTGSPLSQSGDSLSGGWSSGELQAGASSQTIRADKAGTYLFGCAIHYGAPMRGAIVAQ